MGINVQCTQSEKNCEKEKLILDPTNFFRLNKKSDLKTF